jgi:tRNA (mo5U34)-methyltransferase
MIDPSTSSPAERQALVDRYSWAQTIDLGDGVVTKGIFGNGRPPNPIILRAFDELDFKGKRVLEIGCWDGLWSFQAEQRGASLVHATDLVTQRPFAEQPTFRIAHQFLRSKVLYNPTVSVYDVDCLDGVPFDVVIFCGVYYHLKDPLRALSRLRNVIRTGGTIIVEGEAIYKLADTYARFYYRTRHNGDASNWWVPTVACLREWVECSFFDVKKEYAFDVLQPDWFDKLPVVSDRSALEEMLAKTSTLPQETVTRYAIVGEAVTRSDANYGAPDSDLANFGGWRK